MKKSTVIGTITATLLLSGIAATAYAVCRPNAEIDLAVDESGAAIAVGLEPILGQGSDEAASGTVPDAIMNAVVAQHAEFINAPADSIRVQASSRQTWSDGCLGLGGPAEACLFALTEGWQVTVVDGTDEATTYRTNLNGDSIRREPKNGEPAL